MSINDRPNASGDMADRLGVWLKEAGRSMSDADQGLEQLLDRLPTTPQRRHWGRLAWSRRRDDASRSVAPYGTTLAAHGRSPIMFGAFKLVVAGAIVALVGGFAFPASW